MKEADGARLSEQGTLVVWNQEPYRAGLVTKEPKRPGLRKWCSRVYDGEPVRANLIAKEFAFTRSGAVGKLARRFAMAGISVRKTVLEAMAGEGEDDGEV